MTRRVTLLTRNQFGYQTDYFNYQMHLASPTTMYEVSNICLDAGLPKISPLESEVFYAADHSDPKFMRLIKLLNAGWQSLKAGDTVIAKYFPGISFLRLNRNRINLIIDIRTMSVASNSLKRLVQDTLCRFEIWKAPRITVVSAMVAGKLKLTKWFLLPLGANIPLGLKVQVPGVRYEKPIFVYAGTLDGRDLSVLLQAFKLASLSVESRLRIIGDGESKLELQAIARKLGIANEVDFFGHIPHGSKFSELLSTSTFGIVHVPPTAYYAGQPSTKLYEYWAHGLPVLCSNYPSGAGELEIGTGAVYEFNSGDLAECMIRSLKEIEDFNLTKIKELALEHTWEKIVKNYLEPAIRSD